MRDSNLAEVQPIFNDAAQTFRDADCIGLASLVERLGNLYKIKNEEDQVLTITAAEWQTLYDELMRLARQNSTQNLNLLVVADRFPNMSDLQKILNKIQTGKGDEQCIKDLHEILQDCIDQLDAARAELKRKTKAMSSTAALALHESLEDMILDIREQIRSIIDLSPLTINEKLQLQEASLKESISWNKRYVIEEAIQASIFAAGVIICATALALGTAANPVLAGIACALFAIAAIFSIVLTYMIDMIANRMSSDRQELKTNQSALFKNKGILENFEKNYSASALKKQSEHSVERMRALSEFLNNATQRRG